MTKPNGELWNRIATGSSGDMEVELAFLAVLEEQFRVFCVKQRDYGRGNIAKRGEEGVRTRLDDKVARLEQLNKSGGDPANEPILDTWIDIANYGAIGYMCHTGSWPAPTITGACKSRADYDENYQ